MSNIAENNNNNNKFFLHYLATDRPLSFRMSIAVLKTCSFGTSLLIQNCGCTDCSVAVWLPGSY